MNGYDSESSEESDLACFFQRHVVEEECSSNQIADDEVLKTKERMEQSNIDVRMMDGLETKVDIYIDGILKPIVIVQEATRGIGFQLWPAAKFLCNFLQSERAAEYLPKPLSECCVLELGAGVGLVGMYAASLGAQTFITDLQEILPMIDANVLANPYLKNSNIHIEALDWTTLDWEKFQDNSLFLNECHQTQKIKFLNETFESDMNDGGGGSGGGDEMGQALKKITEIDCKNNSELNEILSKNLETMILKPYHDGLGLDLILCADCVYWPVLFDSLVLTLRGLCGPTINNGKGAVVLMAHTRRWKKDNNFFKLVGKYLSVTKVYEVVIDTTDNGGEILGSKESSEANRAKLGGYDSPFGISNPRVRTCIYLIKAKS